MTAARLFDSFFRSLGPCKRALPREKTITQYQVKDCPSCLYMYGVIDIETLAILSYLKSIVQASTISSTNSPARVPVLKF